MNQTWEPLVILLLLGMTTGCELLSSKEGDGRSARYSNLDVLPLDKVDVIVGETDQMHILQKGETLYRLSREYGVPIAELVQANGIKDPTALRIGMKIRIPKGSGGP